MSNIINLNARLVALEARRRGQQPDRQRLAEAEARLIARANATHGLEDLRAFMAEIEGGAAERRPVTIIDLNRRLAALEQRRNPPAPDPRIAEEARERARTNILAILASFDRGEPPNNLMGHALVEHDLDVYRACMSLVGRRGPPQ